MRRLFTAVKRMMLCFGGGRRRLRVSFDTGPASIEDVNTLQSNKRRDVIKNPIRHVMKEQRHSFPLLKSCSLKDG